MSTPLHPSRHRKEFSSLTAAQRARFRQLIDLYIATENPVGEHKAAGDDPAQMIHHMGFLAWHEYFLAKLEDWLVVRQNASEFVPLPYWYPATPVPPELNRGNKQPSEPFPPELKLGAIASIEDYMSLNEIIVPYHNKVHDQMGGLMPNPDTSPGDPIFWPFHAFLMAIYEHWRYH